MKKIIAFLTLFCVSTTPVVQAQSKFSQVYKPGSTLFVSSVAGMSLRIKPSTQGDVLAVVKFGERVLVLADANPRVSFVSTSVPGTWVKVKAGDQEGYVFDGFLSRYPPMPVSGDFQWYLKEQFKVKSETDKAPGDDYNDYLKISFTNGVDYFLNAPIGSTSITTSFPSPLFTFQEVFLLARLAYPEFFTSNRCEYRENDMSCSIEFEDSLTIMKAGNAFIINYGHAD